MLIGCPKEIKNHEYRVGLTPASVRELVQNGHKVMIQSGAGDEIGLDDAQYHAAGAELVSDAATIFSQAEMVVKVKEPQAKECAQLRAGQLLFTYLHLAPDPEQTKALIQSNCVAIAYETVTDKQGRLPLLAPMSEVAGRMAVQAGAHYLEKAQGGRGMLLGGVPGVAPARVVIIGGGVVGYNSARIAVGMGADVVVLDKSIARLAELDREFRNSVRTLYATSDAIEEQVLRADVVIGAVLVPGDAAPKLVSRAMVSRMKRGSVIVDVAIDQGGCVETAKATTHADPVYVVDGVIHYCVANMPGAVARTSTFALNNATLPYTLALANKGWLQACRDDEGLRNGLNVANGRITCPGVAHALNYPLLSANDAIATGAKRAA
ncbi:MAG: alanine dehydrogenase [Alphaproteobacteria bacterium]|nr:alanine dehydrogenase [Alphaproteobacteria bacterium]NDC56477.1 alanine dehydrogenase [Alphaproteobacteria bacterium]NDG04733.1 alanine dehydrogenase [Alphaproteobacteria bacterium]